MGVMLGSIIAITVALAGLGAIITTSAILYDILKYAGAAYLIYLGVSMWRRKFTFKGKLSLFQISQVQIFRDTFLVSAFNPKDMLFFVAFLPQFIAYEGAVFTQLIILGTTFVALGGLNTILWSSMAGGFRNMITNSNVMGRINKVGGTGLFSAGIFTAISGRLS
ncbi:LysE family translocator [Pseudovibrio sp. Tun.PSC04-5.I4]|uniref:LysE family translocator n=1 Tax=Pseudovibrio sp. Tun.PSC04-5.I4 TaxID=1798213 RepID=UPI00244ECD79|nr:LysE family translocator [Pseudovibrio sp. Tun.PSC04-5.I4]